jgi:hypothetical protein
VTTAEVTVSVKPCDYNDPRRLVADVIAHTVVPGDTLCGIAQNTNAPIDHVFKQPKEPGLFVSRAELSFSA